MEKRIESVRKQLNSLQVEALFITKPSNRRYLSGFTGSSGYVLITKENALFITDFRYIEQAKIQTKGYEIIKHGPSVIETVKEQLKRLNIKRLAFEEEVITYKQFTEFQKEWDFVELVPVSQVVENIRIYKDDEEVKLIKTAVEIADEAFLHILQWIKPGMTEIEVALELENAMRKRGASGASFDIIVASGIRSALPHGVASDKIIENGDMVTIDFGAVYQGYISDLTRTIAIGKPVDQLQEIYKIVLEAQLNGVNNTKAGMSGKEADALTRDIIASYGYAEYFGHGTGHGIGLDVHETPVLSSRYEGKLENGMMFTIEPGIYIPELGGVRIEDDVYLSDNGLEVLSKLPKELIII